MISHLQQKTGEMAAIVTESSLLFFARVGIKGGVGVESSFHSPVDSRKAVII
jgi:hypothetical protein